MDAHRRRLGAGDERQSLPPAATRVLGQSPVPVVLGLASSHAPSMFVGAQHWPEVYRGLAGKAPPPPELAQETPAVLEDYARRVTKGFAALRAELDAAKPDAVFIIGDDQNELFS